MIRRPPRSTLFPHTPLFIFFLDHHATQVTGEVTANTIGNGPTPSTQENLQTGASGAVNGSVTTSSARQFKIAGFVRSEEHTSELQSHLNLVCRLLLEKKTIA